MAVNMERITNLESGESVVRPDRSDVQMGKKEGTAKQMVDKMHEQTKAVKEASVDGNLHVKYDKEQTENFNKAIENLNKKARESAEKPEDAKQVTPIKYEVNGVPMQREVFTVEKISEKGVRTLGMSDAKNTVNNAMKSQVMNDLQAAEIKENIAMKGKMSGAGKEAKVEKDDLARAQRVLDNKAYEIDGDKVTYNKSAMNPPEKPSTKKFDKGAALNAPEAPSGAEAEKNGPEK